MMQQQPQFAELRQFCDKQFHVGQPEDLLIFDQLQAAVDRMQKQNTGLRVECIKPFLMIENHVIACMELLKFTGGQVKTQGDEPVLYITYDSLPTLRISVKSEEDGQTLLYIYSYFAANALATQHRLEELRFKRKVAMCKEKCKK